MTQSAGNGPRATHFRTALHQVGAWVTSLWRRPATRPRHAASRWSPIHRRAALGGVCMLVALTGWALASPVGASPDEDYHLTSIWCAYGERAGACAPGPTETSRLVRSELVVATCYAFNPLESAACQPKPPAEPELVASERGNFAGGAYPPVFYWFSALFVSDNVAASVVVMRIANVVVYLALVAALYLMLPAGLRRPMIGAALITAVPLGAFVIASINPSGWAMLSAVTVLVSVLGFLQAEQRRRRIALGVLAALALLVGAGARADAAAYAVVSIVAAVLLAARAGSLGLRRLAFPAGLAVAAMLAFVSVGQSGAVDPGATPMSLSLGRLVTTALDTPALWAGALGTWGLGWLDTAMRPAVWVAASAVYIGVLFLATMSLARRQVLAVALVAAATFAVPTYISFIQGPGVQPRYVLPLMAILAATALVRLSGRAFQLTSGQRWFVVGALTLANAIALHTNIRRYVTGLDPAAGWNLDRDIEWWWPIPASPLTVWAVAAVAFGVGVALLTAEFTTEAPAAGPARAQSSAAMPPADGAAPAGSAGGAAPNLAVAEDRAPTAVVGVARGIA